MKEKKFRGLSKEEILGRLKAKAAADAERRRAEGRPTRCSYEPDGAVFHIGHLTITDAEAAEALGVKIRAIHRNKAYLLEIAEGEVDFINVNVKPISSEASHDT